MEKHERLKQARANAGFGSASDAARDMGITISAYVHHENGTRDFSDAAAQKYARRFNVTVAWLVFGQSLKGAGIDRQLAELPADISDKLIGEFNAMVRTAKLLGKANAK
jgi:DNA-binding XRE family transcriptional regulator